MAEQSIIDADAWKSFETRLRGYVRRRVDPALVDDVLGDIMLRLVRHQDELAAASNPTAWALRVASNAVVDHYRRGATEKRAGADAGSIDWSGDLRPKEDESESVAASEIAQCLVPFIRGLPDPYGEALMMTDIKGVSQTEAARRLGLSVSGMKSRVQRGRRKLKDALLRCCAIELDARGGVIDYDRRRAGCRPGC